MSSQSSLPENIAAIQAVIDQTMGNTDVFAERLRRDGIPHLSFSQVTTVEFCQRRYYLQYVALVDPDPPPAYFLKGKLLHKAIAVSYERVALQLPLEASYPLEIVDQHYHGENGHHLKNAVQVHLENLWLGCRVVAVEWPFVIALDEHLPPCVGVIDLILEREGVFILVDHKTGRDFYPLDELQMAIYVEYIRRQYGAVECQFYYDRYRWVNNLRLIRKPAFQRQKVSSTTDSWPVALKRIQKAYKQIKKIREKKQAKPDGECFRCPFHSQCRP